MQNCLLRIMYGTYTHDTRQSEEGVTYGTPKWRGQLTVAVADPGAEVGGRGDVFPVGRLEAGLLLLIFLLLLVSLLHLALAHPAWGQKDGVITRRYCSYRRGGEGGW